MFQFKAHQNASFDTKQELNRLHLQLSILKCESVIFSLRSYNIGQAVLFHERERIPLKIATQIFGGNSGLSINSVTTHIRSKAMYILQVLSSTQWGGYPVVLSVFYKLLVRSKMNYGFFLNGSAIPTPTLGKWMSFKIKH